MAFTAVTSDITGLQNALKIVYDKKAIRNLLGINSPLMRMIGKDRVQGKAWNWPVLYSQSPAVAADFTIAQGEITTMAAYEVSVTPGMLWAPFNTTAAEILAGASTVGAYPPTPPALVTRHFAATEGFRKTLASCLYGSGWLEIGVTLAQVSLAAVTFEVLDNTRAVLAIGSQIYFTDNSTGLPSDPILATGGPHTVTAMSPSTTAGRTVVTFTPAISGNAPASGAFVELAGGRNAGIGSYALAPIGLGAWVPSFGGRTTAAWTSYIGTSFFGLTRSTNVNRLAGSFYKAQQSSEKRVDGLLEGLRLVRDQGGEANLIVANSYVIRKIMGELTGSLSYFQGTNMGNPGAADEATRGFRSVKVNFLDTGADLVADPFCPVDNAYVLEKEVLSIKSYTNIDTPLKEPGVEDANAGVQGVEDTDVPPQDFRFLTNDYLSIIPGTSGAYGPVMQVILQFIGNFIVDNPSHTCVISTMT